MSVMEFKKAVSRCDFLFDWQKERLVSMLDGVDDKHSEMGGNGHVRDEDRLPVRAEDVFPILDNVLWRTIGVGLDSLPTGDRLNIEYAVREAAY